MGIISRVFLQTEVPISGNCMIVVVVIILVMVRLMVNGVQY